MGQVMMSMAALESSSRMGCDQTYSGIFRSREYSTMAGRGVRLGSNEVDINNSTFHDWSANSAATKDDKVLSGRDNTRGPVGGLFNLGVHPALNSSLESIVRIGQSGSESIPKSID